MQSFGPNKYNSLIKRYVYTYIVVWALISVAYEAISAWIMLEFFTMTSVTILFASFFLSTTVFGVALSIYAFLILNVRMRLSLINDTLRFVCLID